MVSVLEEYVDWHDLAACRDVPNADTIFFPVSSRPEASLKARGICAGCPVRAQCEQEAEHDERDKSRVDIFGVRAGLTATERWRKYGGMDIKAPSPREVEAAIRKREGAKRLREISQIARGSRPAAFDAPQTQWLTGASDHQLRYWAQTGLVVPSVQDTGGKPGVPRRYSSADVRKVKAILARLFDGESLQHIRSTMQDERVNAGANA